MISASRISRYTQSLRFPVLAMITGGAFLLDVLVPDLIPFADEVLLGLLLALFARWKKKDTTPDAR
jgi:hypothetical protein